MIIYFADRKMNILGQASTGLPEGLSIIDDLKTEEVDAGAATLSFRIPYTKELRLEVERWASVGNYLLRKNGSENECYTIIDSECDSGSEEMEIYAEDVGLDLLNEVVAAYEADKAYPIAYYIEKFTYDSGFEIGLNEISNLSKKLKWEGEQTATERILSVAAQFDNAEISYSFEVDQLSIIHKQINIYKSKGKDIGVELRLNRDISRIVTKRSVANLATSLSVTGEKPEGKDKPITLKGYHYDDGDFYIDGDRLNSRKALSKWSRYLSENDNDIGHIVKTFYYSTTNQEELCSRAISNLKKSCEPEENYEIDIINLPDNVQIGDTVNIVDGEGGLYLSARILKLEISVSNKTQKATLGNYLIKDSGISQRIEMLAEQFEEIAKKRPLYTWIAYADDPDGNGASLSPEGKKYIGLVTNRFTDDADISDPSVFQWVQSKGEKGEAGVPGEKGEQGPEGEAGKTTFFHIKYSSVEHPAADQMTDVPDVYIGTYADFLRIDSVDPADYNWYRFQGLQGPKGDRGIPGKNGEDGNTCYLHIKYSNDGGITFTGTDGEEAGSWIGQYVDFYQSDSPDPTKYTWVKMEGDKGETGEAGKDAAIISITEPEDKTMLWCDISVTPPLMRQWNGEKWVIVNDTTAIIEQVYQNLYSIMDQTVDNIMIQMGEKSYLKDEVDRLIGDVNTQYVQTSQSFEYKFNQLLSEITGLSSDTETKFTEVNKYIRFVDGAIIIGVEGNPFILKMKNERISFLENGSEVAYISNRRMYITDVEVINSLIIGNFAFLPRNNGNLTFRKVRG